MTQLDISGGTLPSGVMIRESPTKTSPGQTISVKHSDTDYEFTSYFDINLEISTDSGSTWQPAVSVCPMVLSNGVPFPTHYTSPNLPPFSALYTNGTFTVTFPGPPTIVISNITHWVNTNSFPPPLPGHSQVEHFPSLTRVDMQVSINGAAFVPSYGYANVTVWIRNASDIPTLTEWGLIVMGLLLLTVGAVFLLRHRRALPETAGGA